MARPLDILALEPYFGGVRKSTVELWQKNSRHHWHLHTLPPRRLDRRLAAAAQWFAEEMSRHPKRRYDLVLASDALNLADLLRLVPSLAGVPSVLYAYRDPFASTEASDDGMKSACLASADAASEVWFPSLHVMKSMLSGAAELADARPESGGRAPLKALIAKAQVVYPPIAAEPPRREAGVTDAVRMQRGVCLDNRFARPDIYLPFLQLVSDRQEPINLQILGDPLSPLPDGIAATVVSPQHEAELFHIFQQAEIFISAPAPSMFGAAPLLAMAAGCIPLMPQIGFFREYLPTALHRWCLFDLSPEDLHSKVTDLWYLRRPAVEHNELTAIFSRYQPANATRFLDDRMEQLARHAAEQA